jgi:glutaredoxin-like protein
MVKRHIDLLQAVKHKGEITMTERLLDENIQGQIRTAFEQLQDPVRILFFGQKDNCEYCDETRQLAEEVAELSDKLIVEAFDLEDDASVAENYNVDKAPGLVLAAETADGPIDYGIRYAGIPSGHEFSSLIQDLILISGRDSGLNEQTRDFLAQLEEPVTLQVFVTPTCPYCPQAVILAHQMAMESSLVQAEMVEATEFPELSNKYHIMGVPDTVINHGKNKMVGAAPEAKLIAEIMKALAK